MQLNLKSQQSTEIRNIFSWNYISILNVIFDINESFEGLFHKIIKCLVQGHKQDANGCSYK